MFMAEKTGKGYIRTVLVIHIGPWPYPLTLDSMLYLTKRCEDVYIKEKQY
jgi:hypothetical protein